MEKDIVILIAEDDEGHLTLINRNLQRAGLSNRMVNFTDGQQILDFLFMQGDGPKRQANEQYLLFLDIRMPKVNGIEVLEKVKDDPELKKIPVVMLTTTDDPVEIDRCYNLGCSIYVVKPIGHDNFIDAVQKIGLFLSVVEVPQLN